MFAVAALLLAQGSLRAFPVPLSSVVEPATLRVEQFAATRPLYAGLRLVVGDSGQTATEVKKPADLEGKVHIGTQEEALEFVRLLRTPGVWPFLFLKPILEIRHGAVLFQVPELLYKDLRVYTVSGWDGVVDEADWKRLGLPEPKITGGIGKDWSVRRACLVPDGEKFKVGLLVERVSLNGRYVSSVERPEEPPRGIRWHVTTPSRR